MVHVVVVPSEAVSVYVTGSVRSTAVPEAGDTLTPSAAWNVGAS